MRHRAAHLILAALIAGCSPEPSPTPTPVTPSSPAPSPAPSDPAPSAGASPTPTSSPTTSWNRAFVLEVGSLSHLVAWRGTALALGCANDADWNCLQRIIVSSTDGEAWAIMEAAEIDGDLGFGRLHRVGGRIYALGYADGRRFGGAIVLTSGDGRSWTRVRSASFGGRAIDGFVRSPLGTFAIGFVAPPGSDATSGFLMWPVEADGSFGSVRVIDDGDLMALVTGVIWTGTEFLAWGPRGHPMGGGGKTIVVSSPDGLRWSRRAEIKADGNTWVSEVLATEDRLVAVGYEGRRFPLTPRAWTSDDDGRTWTPAAVEGDDARIATVSMENGRLIARGHRTWGPNQLPVSWVSEDGSAWTVLPDDQDLPFVAGFGGLAPVKVGRRTCVAGWVDRDATFSGAIYCRT